eukprot:1157310-Pelagomonas_calceolata.AAC.8
MSESAQRASYLHISGARVHALPGLADGSKETIWRIKAAVLQQARNGGQRCCIVPIQAVHGHRVPCKCQDLQSMLPPPLLRKVYAFKSVRQGKHEGYKVVAT